MLEIQTFGTVGLRARDEGESQAQIVQPKRLALLVYLALAPRRRLRRRDQIVALFWPDLDPIHARAALSQSLSYLRRALGEAAIVTQGEEEVGLNREAVWCDVGAFLTHCELDEFEAALRLYQGPFLDGFFVTDAGPEFERWVAAERVGLSQRARHAALALVGAAAKRGDLPGAIGWARRGLTISPGDEIMTAELIRLLDQAGDRAGALRAYEELRQRLREEFQVVPSPETQALLARILGR
jgi:DNA-binding SARP family transcriptional activator